MESIARVDFCIDVLANDFALDQVRVIAHSNSKRTSYSPEHSFVERGKLIESITIGKMPNKQICVYDKTKEIAVKQTSYWYDIWSTVSNTIGAPKVTIGKNDRVWRLEVRAGKDALHGAKINTFQQMQERLPELFGTILHKCRLVIDDGHDLNVSRLPTHPLWALFQKKAVACFENQVVTMPSTIVTDKLREEYLTMMQKSFLGNAISYTALKGEPLENLDKVIASIGEDVAPYRETDPIRVAEKYRQAKAKYGDL